MSVGLFYYINAKELINSLKSLKKLHIKTNNEYFPSEGFNFIKKVKIKYVNNFAHIGKPDYYEEFINWKNFFIEKNKFKKKIYRYNLAQNILIPAAGDSKRFKKKNIFIPKYLYLIKPIKKRLINYLSEFLPNKKKIIIIKKTKFNYLVNKKNFKTHLLKNNTRGQAETVYKALKDIKNNQSLFINSCDVFSTFNIPKFTKIKKKSDIIVFTSKKSFTDLSDNSYSWVKKIKNSVKDIYIKQRPQKNLKILTGNFYFKNKRIYNDCFERINPKSGGEMYIDQIIKLAIKLKYKVNVLEDREYVNLGTPELIKKFIFWNNYFVKNK